MIHQGKLCFKMSYPGKNRQIGMYFAYVKITEKLATK
jgi:hypothetical protein